MLEPLFGNATTEKILLYLYAYPAGYARLISREFSISVSGVCKQLRRLEDGGVIVGIQRGRTRLFQLNPRYPFRRELKALLAKAMEFLPEDERARYFMQRTRPRRTGKPL